MTDLNKLADRVEAGKAENKDVFNALGGPLANYGTGATYPIALDSLDAAKALHDAVLPGWDYMVNPDTVAVWSLVSPQEGHGKADNPAAAWVAAILRAKAQEER